MELHKLGLSNCDDYDIDVDELIRVNKQLVQGHVDTTSGTVVTENCVTTLGAPGTGVSIVHRDGTKLLLSMDDDTPAYRQTFPDGTKIIYCDGASIIKKPDGTKLLKSCDGDVLMARNKAGQKMLHVRGAASIASRADGCKMLYMDDNVTG